MRGHDERAHVLPTRTKARKNQRTKASAPSNKATAGAPTATGAPPSSQTATTPLAAPQEAPPPVRQQPPTSAAPPVLPPPPRQDSHLAQRLYLPPQLSGSLGGTVAKYEVDVSKVLN